MKKIIALVTCLVLIMGYSSSSVFASQSNISKNLTKNQIKILKAYGLSEKEISNITLDTIRDTLKHGKIVNTSVFGKAPVDDGTNRIPERLKEKFNSLNLSMQQLEGLRRAGYTFDEIANKDKSTINSIIAPSTLTATPPSGYNNYPNIPNGGGAVNYFNPAVSIDSSDINFYVYFSREYTKHIFNLSSDPADGTYSYYLYGEWDGTSVDPYGTYDGIPGGTHEGVDVKYNYGANVYNATPGIVLRTQIGGDLDGFIQIYDDYLNETITYMHVNNTTLSQNDTVLTTTKLGTQSTLMGHVHFQAYDSNSTQMPTGKDDTLECASPYNFMTWYIL